jgi:hypothetical protein
MSVVAHAKVAIAGIGQEPDRVPALAASDRMKAALQTQTDTARPPAFWR